MPIDIDQFEHLATADRPPSERQVNAERVLSYLATNREQAFTPSELQAAVDVPPGNVGVVLARLEDRGLVRHRGGYWAVGDRTAVDWALDLARTADESGAATESVDAESVDEPPTGR